MLGVLSKPYKFSRFFSLFCSKIFRLNSSVLFHQECKSSKGVKKSSLVLFVNQQSFLLYSSFWCYIQVIKESTKMRYVIITFIWKLHEKVFYMFVVNNHWLFFKEFILEHLCLTSKKNFQGIALVSSAPVCHPFVIKLRFKIEPKLVL